MSLALESVREFYRTNKPVFCRKNSFYDKKSEGIGLPHYDLLNSSASD